MDKSQNPIAQFEGYDGDTGEPLVKWYDRSKMPQPGDKLCVVGESSMSGKLGLEGLTRWSASPRVLGAMEQTSGGNYFRRIDVERLLATQSQAAAPVTDYADCCDTPHLRSAVRRCTAKDGAHPAAAVEPVAIPAGWISVEDSLPGRECLAVYVTPGGKQRLIRAKYARQFQIEAQGDDCETEYNDDDDTFYIKAGWLECIDNWGEYSSCYVTEGTVTHWMPLPAAPGASPIVPDPTADEAALYRDLTGDAMKLGYDGIPAALEALRKVRGEVLEEAEDAIEDVMRNLEDDVAEWSGAVSCRNAIRALKSQRQASNQGEQA